MEYNKHEVTVILTVWKRNHLKEQIEALLGQTITPTQIWVIQCMRHVSVQEVLVEFPFVKFIYSDIDLKYFSRFSIGIHAPSEFTWVLDDDIIPGRAWIENCITTSIKHNAIISSNGRIIPPNDFYPEKIKGAGYMSQHFIGHSPVKGAPNFCEKDTFVDFPCSSYFFRTEWLRYFWGIWPVNLKTAEDIHFAASCMLMRQIGTVVPRQISAPDSGNLKPTYSLDEHASWSKGGFLEYRSEVLRYFIENKGWIPLKWKGEIKEPESNNSVSDDK